MAEKGKAIFEELKTLGFVWLEKDCVVGHAINDGEIVQLGTTDNLKSLYNYLEAYPSPEMW